MTIQLRRSRTSWNDRFRVYVEGKDLSINEVARQLERSPAVIYYWLNGVSTPREDAQTQVKKWSRGRVKPDNEVRGPKAPKAPLKRTGTDN